jgi:hypothetical protein
MAYLNLGASPLTKGRASRARGQAGDDDFRILRRNGHWSIFSSGSYFGQYESVERALPLAIRVARDAARAGVDTRVVLMAEDGRERVLWQVDQVSSLADITSS